MKFAVICVESPSPGRLNGMIECTERIARDGRFQVPLSASVIRESHVHDSGLAAIIGNHWTSRPAAIEV